MVTFVICQLLATPGLFEYFCQNMGPSENQSFLDEGAISGQQGLGVLGEQITGLHDGIIFRWFKFTLKPPYSGVSEHSLLAIWDTSHWNFFVKFGLKTPYDIS